MSLRVILSGVSSFTGFWIATYLANSGHSVVCPLPRGEEDYSGLKKIRINSLPESVGIVYDAPYGSKRFLELFAEGCDILCLHAAQVENYNHYHFSATEAIYSNTKGAEKLLECASACGCRKIIWSASVFEDIISLDEPTTKHKPAWYRYALSKKVSGLIYRALSEEENIEFSRFVITNPFGPYEDPKICTSLAEAIMAKKSFQVKKPFYVRDMIHVQHLAEVYSNSVSISHSSEKMTEIRPSEYCGNMLGFTKMFNREIGSRIGKSCELSSVETMSFEEPESLMNKTHVSLMIKNYSPHEKWSELAKYYETYLS